MRDTASLAAARQQALLASGAPDGFETLGVGMLHDAEKGVAYAFAYFAGDPAMPADLLEHIEATYGPRRFDELTSR